ncbi:MAG TPA: hypothetical protein VI112_03735 [Bacteroidia bacterium]|jgi:hypothetical protein
MEFFFSTHLPPAFKGRPVLISGPDSEQLQQAEYLIPAGEEPTRVFKIKFSNHCSPFKQAEMMGEYLLAGHEEHFYFFNTSRGELVFKQNMNGYFGRFYSDNEFLYIADASGLHCITRNGKMSWQNNSLGVDGVVINQISDDSIYGSGEWDPPGGWKDFVLDKKSGLLLHSSSS